MSTHRNGDEQLSGEARRPQAAPHAGATTEPDGAFDLDSLAERIGEALRQHPLDTDAEQAALTAFRRTRPRQDGALRTRRQDDWRPRTPKQRWARGSALTLAASTLMGGIAFASITGVGSTQHHAPEARTSASPHRTPATGPGRQRSPSTGPGTTPTPSPSHPDTAQEIEAHCRAYEKIKSRGQALNATAWQRLLRAAGGEQQVAGYCARLAGSDATTPMPSKTNKAKGSSKGEKPKKTGEGLEKPSAETKLPKTPSDRQ